MAKVVSIDSAARHAEHQADARALLDAAAEAAVAGKMYLREFVEEAENQWLIHNARAFTSRTEEPSE